MGEDLDSNTSVSITERGSWAVLRIGFDGWFWGSVTAVIGGLAAATFGASPLVWGIASGALVLGVRFAGSFAKAEREILRQRLQVANQRLATLEQEADDSTKLLASICAFGQNVLAIGRRVRTDNDLEVWRGYLERFNDALESAMTNTLDVHENTLVRHADPEGIEFEHPFNEYHSEEWRKLKRRVQALEKIIERRRK